MKRLCLSLCGWLLVLLVLQAPAVAGAAAAADLLLARSVLEDPQAAWTIDDVAARTFTPYEQSLALGYKRSAVWVRLVVRAPSRGQEVVLRITPTNLDEVTLYEPDGPGWRRRITGDRHPSAQREVGTLALGFVVRVPGPQTTVYLRLKTTSLMQLGLEALDPLASERRDHEIDQMQLLALGFIVWGMLWALQNYVTDRDPVVGAFALNQAALLLYGLALLGYVADWLPGDRPSWVDGTSNVLLSLWPVTASLLNAALLRRYQPPRAWILGCLGIFLAHGLALTLLATGHTMAAMALTNATNVAARWYFLAMALAARSEGVPSRRVVRAVHFVLACAGTVIIASEVGWLAMPDSPQRRIWYLLAFGIISTSLLVAIVRARLQAQRLETQQAQVDLALSRQALELERAHREQAQTLAHTDFLTGLANRRRFVELGEQAVNAARRVQRPLALLMIDLDHFKSLNDAMGHATGDQVLESVARRAQDALRDHDLLGRIGGEEFAALLHDTDAGQALEIARRLRTAVSAQPIALADGRRVPVSVSIGLTALGGRSASLSELLNEADQALHHAKAGGRDTQRLYDEALSARARLRAQLTRELAGALEAGELAIEYQPVFDTASGAPLGAEALLRWHHPRLGRVMPEAFVDVAEDTGLIGPIGAWALQQACLEAMRWPSPLKVSVNVSVRQLHGAGLVDAVREALACSGLAAGRLELEITESALAQEAVAAGVLNALHALGVGLALDDFGTGFSSLAYVQRFRFDRLKIDRAFVRSLGVGGRPDAEALVRAVIDLARALGLQCTAEGIETAEQLERLRRLGCGAVQGFHLARPMDGPTWRAQLATAPLVPRPAPQHIGS